MGTFREKCGLSAEDGSESADVREEEGLQQAGLGWCTEAGKGRVFRSEGMVESAGCSFQTCVDLPSGQTSEWQGNQGFATRCLQRGNEGCPKGTPACAYR